MNNTNNKKVKNRSLKITGLGLTLLAATTIVLTGCKNDNNEPSKEDDPIINVDPSKPDKPGEEVVPPKDDEQEVDTTKLLADAKAEAKTAIIMVEGYEEHKDFDLVKAAYNEAVKLIDSYTEVDQVKKSTEALKATIEQAVVAAVQAKTVAKETIDEYLLTELGKLTPAESNDVIKVQIDDAKTTAVSSIDNAKSQSEISAIVEDTKEQVTYLVSSGETLIKLKEAKEVAKADVLKDLPDLEAQKDFDLVANAINSALLTIDGFETIDKINKNKEALVTTIVEAINEAKTAKETAISDLATFVETELAKLTDATENDEVKETIETLKATFDAAVLLATSKAQLEELLTTTKTNISTVIISAETVEKLSVAIANAKVEVVTNISNYEKFKDFDTVVNTKNLVFSTLDGFTNIESLTNKLPSLKEQIVLAVNEAVALKENAKTDLNSTIKAKLKLLTDGDTNDIVKEEVEAVKAAALNAIEVAINADEVNKALNNSKEEISTLIDSAETKEKLEARKVEAKAELIEDLTNYESNKDFDTVARVVFEGNFTIDSCTNIAAINSTLEEYKVSVTEAVNNAHLLKEAAKTTLHTNILDGTAKLSKDSLNEQLILKTDEIYSAFVADVAKCKSEMEINLVLSKAQDDINNQFSKGVTLEDLNDAKKAAKSSLITVADYESNKAFDLVINKVNEIHTSIDAFESVELLEQEVEGYKAQVLEAIKNAKEIKENAKSELASYINTKNEILTTDSINDTILQKIPTFQVSVNSFIDAGISEQNINEILADAKTQIDNTFANCVTKDQLEKAKVETKRLALEVTDYDKEKDFDLVKAAVETAYNSIDVVTSVQETESNLVDWQFDIQAAVNQAKEIKETHKTEITELVNNELAKLTEASLNSQIRLDLNEILDSCKTAIETATSEQAIDVLVSNATTEVLQKMQPAETLEKLDLAKNNAKNQIISDIVNYEANKDFDVVLSAVEAASNSIDTYKTIDEINTNLAALKETIVEAVTFAATKKAETVTALDSYYENKISNFTDATSNASILESMLDVVEFYNDSFNTATNVEKLEMGLNEAKIILDNSVFGAETIEQLNAAKEALKNDLTTGITEYSKHSNYKGVIDTIYSVKQDIDAFTNIESLNAAEDGLRQRVIDSVNLAKEEKEAAKVEVTNFIDTQLQRIDGPSNQKTKLTNRLNEVKAEMYPVIDTIQGKQNIDSYLNAMFTNMRSEVDDVYREQNPNAFMKDLVLNQQFFKDYIDGETKVGMIFRTIEVLDNEVVGLCNNLSPEQAGYHDSSNGVYVWKKILGCRASRLVNEFEYNRYQNQGVKLWSVVCRFEFDFKNVK